MIRILHTSDWHLGRLFYERSLVEDQEHVLAQIIELARTQKPHAVVIAGDVYDRAIPPPQGMRLLDWALSELVLGVRVPVFLISGNHDSGERLGFGARLLSAGHRLRIVGTLSEMLTPMELEDEHGKVELFGIPYSDPSEVRVGSGDASIQGHQEAMSWCVREIMARRSAAAILTAHAYVAGGTGADSERPLTIGGKPFVSVETFDGFAYTALGHLHGRQTFAGGKVHYSGSLLPYHFSERETPKSVSLVEMGKDRIPRVEHVELKPKRRLVVVSGKYDEILAQAKLKPNRLDYVLVRREYDGPRPDAMAQLRAHYDNLVAIEMLPREETTGAAGGADESVRRAVRQGTDLYALFEGFYRKMAPEPLTEEQAKRLAAHLATRGRPDDLSASGSEVN
jgi:exonuclease SbcD